MVGLAGLVACALAVGGVTSALVIPGAGGIPGNIIRAGHLVLEVNQGQATDLDIENLVPGEERSGDQLITADLRGVERAALRVSLSGVRPGQFADSASLEVSYSDPEPAAQIAWAGGRCTPTAAYSHAVGYPALSRLDGGKVIDLGSLTGGDNGLCVRFRIALDPAADNSVQGESTEFAITYSLQQTAASP